MAQPEIFPARPISFSPKTYLVSSPVVQAIRGIDADAVQSAVETGQLRFVWNLNAQRGRKKICELRFWLPEIAAPLPASVTLRDVINMILGEHRHSWRGMEVAQMLLVSRPCIHRLRKSRALPGTITGNTLWIQKPALEKFLQARWLGSAINPQAAN